MKLKDLQLKKPSVALGDMGSVVRPFVQQEGVQILGEYGEHYVTIYMPLVSSDIFPSICGDYTELNHPDCQYRIVLIDGKMKSIEKRLRGDTFYRLPVARNEDDWDKHTKIINTQLIGSIERIIVFPVRISEIPPPIIPELPKRQ
jgi:hypothetical protein